MSEVDLKTINNIEMIEINLRLAGILHKVPCFVIRQCQDEAGKFFELPLEDTG